MDVDDLTHRKQLVEIGDSKSDMATVEFGVPQSSILGGLFQPLRRRPPK